MHCYIYKEIVRCTEESLKLTLDCRIRPTKISTVFRDFSLISCTYTVYVVMCNISILIGSIKLIIVI